jgi:hypothetical protein
LCFFFGVLTSFVGPAFRLGNFQSQFASFFLGALPRHGLFRSHTRFFFGAQARFFRALLDLGYLAREPRRFLGYTLSLSHFLLSLAGFGLNP